METFMIVMKVLFISSLLSVAFLYVAEWCLKMFRFFTEDGISSWYYGRKDTDD